MQHNTNNNNITNIPLDNISQLSERYNSRINDFHITRNILPQP